MFRDKRSRYFGIIKTGFDHVFGATSSREIGDWKYYISKIRRTNWWFCSL